MRSRNQLVLPINFEILIDKNDAVWKVVEICDELDYTKLYDTYLRSWRKIDPATLFVIILFAYMNRIYSARDIEKACKTDIRFMWLLQGAPVPNHSTFARFQDERLTAKLNTELPEICRKYGLLETSTLDEVLSYLINVARLMNIEFVYGKGKRKTEIQRDYDKLYGYKDGMTEGKLLSQKQSMERQKKDATERIQTNEGIQLRMNRSIQVEGAFGVIKQDFAFRRFLTRGKKKTETQFFLLAFAFNLQKLWNRSNSRRFNVPLFKNPTA